MARRRPLPDTPALIDVRVLLVAALLVAPAAWQAGQGLLSVDQVLVRYLMVAIGCTLVTAVGRSMWPIIAGESAPEPTAEPSGPAERSAEPEMGLS